MTSRIVSFRLDDSDPDEAQALAVLSDLEAQGIDKRKFFARALLAAAEKPLAERPVDLVAELRRALDEVRSVAATLRQAPALPVSSAPIEDETALKPELRAAIKRAARPGLKKGQ